MSLFGNTFYARGVFGVMISFLFVCTFVVVIFLSATMTNIAVSFAIIIHVE